MKNKLYIKSNKLYNVFYFFGTGFGCGNFLFFPGTMGSILAIVLWLIAYYFLSILFIWMIVFLCFVFGIVICKVIFTRLDPYDYSYIVFDELIGMWIVLMFIPKVNFYWIFFAFLMFRIFDILKPWPISIFNDKKTNEYNIIIDDVLSALFSVFTIEICNLFFK